MFIELNNIKPTYMSDSEISGSDIYLQKRVIFEEGKKYLIRAKSGHGKSSLLNFIYGNNFSFEGTINYSNSYKNIFDLRKSTISYVFQDFKLFDDLTVLENIKLKNSLTNHKSIDEIKHLIAEVSLEHKESSLVKNLSLGQKQRVAILRALCQPFNFLLLDEPFSHLDEENIKKVTHIISKEVEKQKAGLIMTSLGNTYFFNFDNILNL